MKSKRLIYLAIIASSIMLSCSDDILDKKLSNGYSDLDVFSDDALLKQFVDGTYRGIRHPFDDENSLTDGLTDNAYNQHGSAEGAIKIYTRGEVNQDNGEGITKNLWEQAYQSIYRVNLFFEQTRNSPELTPALLGQYEGEMQTLRAFFYFDLLRWYGGVPIITKVFDLNENHEVARNSIDEVVQFIVAECDNAIAKLPTIDKTPRGRVSKETAMALKARVLLYAASPLFNPSNDKAKWEAARDANQAVMDLSSVSLIGNASQYGAMFSGDNTNEVIFARYFTEVTNQGWGVNLWLLPNSNGGWSTTTPTQDLVDNYEFASGKLPSDPTSGYNPQNPYVNRDPRFYQTILFNGAAFKGATYDPYIDKNDPVNNKLSGKDSRYSSISPHNASRTGYTFRKYVQEDEGEYSGNTGPWIIFRLSEFYLNYAETLIALGDEGNARDAINAVRGRVGMPEVTETGDELIERYRNERRIELVLEDHRFFDIRRWKIGSTVMNKPALGVDPIKDGALMEYKYGIVSDNTRKWVDKMDFLPIPSGEIQRSNGKLTQNPGYSQ